MSIISSIDAFYCSTVRLRLSTVTHYISALSYPLFPNKRNFSPSKKKKRNFTLRFYLIFVLLTLFLILSLTDYEKEIIPSSCGFRAFGSDIQRLRLSDVAGIEKRDYKLLQDYRHQQTVVHRQRRRPRDYLHFIFRLRTQGIHYDD